MDRSPYVVVALANVPTIITVLIGTLLNNGRLNDLNSRMTSFESRMNSMDTKLDTRFDILIRKVDEIANRLTRLESQRH
jgi:hypothetical protein